MKTIVWVLTVLLSLVSTSFAQIPPPSFPSVIFTPLVSAPSGRVNGQCWTTSAGMFCRIAGGDVGPFGGGSGSGTVNSGTSGQGAYYATTGTAVSGLTYGPDFTLTTGTLYVASRTTHGDSNYTILATDRYVTTSATLTTARVWTLQAANALPAGTLVTVSDDKCGVTSTNTLTVQRAGSDTINQTSASVVLNAACGSTVFSSDGVSNWANTGILGTASQANVGMSGHALPFLDQQNTWSHGNAVTPVALTPGTTVSVNAALSNNFTLTPAQNFTLANPTNLLAGEVLNFWVTQDGTGSRVLTLDTQYQAGGGTGTITLSTAAGTKDLLSCQSDTTSTLTCNLTKGIAH